ncbi:hypothetical protein [Proteus myxofaciens]|uniref:Uncharacterized protein n=1 Tax=Proteus myxofaciens ATCC 19692 TaxID=1354337 RepID=A0A198GQX5_9GAMM|nr:hypothetical protein [Proteus myxofaciens]OAT39468.1 hypothetical protein M983_0012 [Proteus myxofaciens ATCC 19692]
MKKKIIKFFLPGYFGLGFLLGIFFPIYLSIYRKTNFDEIILNIIDFMSMIGIHIN